MSDGHEVEVNDVEVGDTWAALGLIRSAQLIDVRTKAEWAFTGYPTLMAIGKRTVFVEWQTFPGKVANANFAEELMAELDKRGVATDDDLYFICRSGIRSLHAARHMAVLGFSACHNVAMGFEGALDGAKHRGNVNGWKHAGLPWVQG